MTERRTYRLSGGLFDREEETSEVKRLFFLSVEGISTEPSYFINLNRVLRDLGVDDATLVVLRHRNDGLSSPDDVYSLLEECSNLRDKGNDTLLPTPVIEKLREEFSEEDIKNLLSEASDVSSDKVRRFRDMLATLGINLNYRDYIKSIPSSADKFVIVIDRDVHSHTRACLEEIYRKCNDRSFICCLTNPCFEFWLLLHLVDAQAFLNSDELKKIRENAKISKRHTYVSGRLSGLAKHFKHIKERTFDKLYKPNIGKAMEGARKFATTGEDVLDNVGTTIPLLIENIFNGKSLT